MSAVAALVRLHLLWLFLCRITTSALALPLVHSSIPQLAPRDIIVTNISGTIRIFDSATDQAILQGPATDGSGTNFSFCAVIWIAFCFIIGTPMTIAGIRGWRFTLGIGIALSAAVCSWAAFINTVGASGIPDLLLTAIVMAFSFLGFVLGLFEFARIAGLVTLGICGGLALGMRLILLKQGLLLSGTSLFAINWVLIALFGVFGGILISWPKYQRVGILFGSASIGTFLVSLGIDLLVYRQSGMSRGLRVLFDRNPAHLMDILTNSYTPQLATQVVIGVSIGLTPAFAYAQHRIFREPFSWKERPYSNISSPIASAFRESRFLSIPRAAAAKLYPKSRFSL